MAELKLFRVCKRIFDKLLLTLSTNITQQTFLWQNIIALVATRKLGSPHTVVEEAVAKRVTTNAKVVKNAFSHYSYLLLLTLVGDAVFFILDLITTTLNKLL